MIGAAIVALLVVAAQAAPAPFPECPIGNFRQLDGGCGNQMPQMPQMPMPMQMPHFNPMMGGYPMNPMMPGFGMYPGYMGGHYMQHPGGMPFGMPFGMPPMMGGEGMPHMMGGEGMPPMPQDPSKFGQMPPGFTMESYDMSYFYPKNENVDLSTPMLTTTEAPKIEVEEAPKVPTPTELPQPPKMPSPNMKPVKDSKPTKDPANRPKQMVKDPPSHHFGQQPSVGPNYPNLQSLLQMMNVGQQPHKQQRPQKHQKPAKHQKKPEPVPEVVPEKSELPPFKYINDFSEEDYTSLEAVKAPKQSLPAPPAQLVPTPALGCPTTDDRYRPVHFKHQNCRKFYKCTNGQAIAQECPPRLMWSEAADRCVLMKGGEC